METIGTDHPQVNRSRMRSAELSMYNLLKKNNLDPERRKGRRGIGVRKQGVFICLRGREQFAARGFGVAERGGDVLERRMKIRREEEGEVFFPQ